MEKFTGPGIKNITEDDLKKFEQERLDSGLVKHPAELEKTHEEEKIFNEIVGFLNKELKSLNLPNVDFPIERLHLLPSHFYWTPQGSAVGEYNSTTNSIRVEVSRIVRLNDFEKIKDEFHKLIHLAPISYLSSKNKDVMVFLHELIHASSISGFFVKTDREIKNYKSGYQSFDPDNLQGFNYFTGINEAVTQKITNEIYNENINKLFKNINPREIDQISKISPYKGYISVLDSIIKSIAEFEYKKEEDVWLDFKKNYFTGEMMHFRKIEKVFGVGSLRVLASMNHSTMSDLDPKEDSKFAHPAVG